MNHPNILAISDFGLHDGAPYLVSELLEGDSLRERLRNEKLPARRPIEYAVQISRGLAAAHERGIVHRDLKPENIFVTRDGHVKILKISILEGTELVSRSDGERPAISPDGKILYFVRRLTAVAGGNPLELYAAAPEDTPQPRLLLRIPGWRAPTAQFAQPVISPDGAWLALMLDDGHTHNLYAIGTATGELRQVADFGRQSTLIARRVSWSPDGRFIFAAVAFSDTDIVLFDHLLGGQTGAKQPDLRYRSAGRAVEQAGAGGGVHRETEAGQVAQSRNGHSRSIHSRARGAGHCSSKRTTASKRSGGV